MAEADEDVSVWVDIGIGIVDTWKIDNPKYGNLMKTILNQLAKDLYLNDLLYFQYFADPLIAMEHILDSLKLLNYEGQFCKQK